MREFTLIAELQHRFVGALDAGYLGIGDDAAVIPATLGGCLVVSTDAMVEGVHFRTDFSTAQDIAWKLVTVNVSDIAAMGGHARELFLVTQFSEAASDDWKRAFVDGLAAAVRAYELCVLGGDTVAAATMSFSATVLGRCAEAPLRRDGVQVGDELWLTGEVGWAALGLSLLCEGTDAIPAAVHLRALECHRRPRSPFLFARQLGRKQCASAAIDVSDGLLQDAGHLARASGLSLHISLDEVPLPREDTRPNAIARALSGGDDYELLVTVPPRQRQAFLETAEAAEISVQCIGRAEPTAEGMGAEGTVLVEQEGVSEPAADFLRRSGVSSAGWEHEV